MVLALWFCAFVAGCSGEKPVEDTEKYHPNGIGIDIETKKAPGTPRR